MKDMLRDIVALLEAKKARKAKKVPKKKSKSKGKGKAKGMTPVERKWLRQAIGAAENIGDLEDAKVIKLMDKAYAADDSEMLDMWSEKHEELGGAG